MKSLSFYILLNEEMGVVYFLLSILYLTLETEAKEVDEVGFSEEDWHVRDALALVMTNTCQT